MFIYKYYSDNIYIYIANTEEWSNKKVLRNVKNENWK